MEGSSWSAGPLNLARLQSGGRPDILEDLAASSFCASLPTEELQSFIDSADIAFLPREATLVAQGDVLDQLVILLRGQVQEQHLTEQGRLVILAIRGPGDLVGFPSFHGGCSITSAVALTSVEAFVVPGPRLRELLPCSPQLVAALMATLTERLRAAELERVDLVTCDSTVRLSRRLLELAERWGQPAQDRIEIPLSLSQADLAARAGLSRESTVRSLQTLRRRGLIRTRRRRIETLDLNGLRRRAQREPR